MINFIKKHSTKIAVVLVNGLLITTGVVAFKNKQEDKKQLALEESNNPEIELPLESLEQIENGEAAPLENSVPAEEIVKEKVQATAPVQKPATPAPTASVKKTTTPKASTSTKTVSTPTPAPKPTPAPAPTPAPKPTTKTKTS